MFRAPSRMEITHLADTCSKSAMGTTEQCVKSGQVNNTIKTLKRRRFLSDVFIFNFEQVSHFVLA